MTRRTLASALALVLVASAIPYARAHAADSAPLPSSMAAVGDSITNGASTDGSLGADAPWNSWSVGTNTTVNSHLLRLQALNGQVVAHNRAVSGAKMVDLHGQLSSVAALEPDPGYVTILIGGNDLCTDTVAEMTPVDQFRAQFASAMSMLMTNTTTTYVYVVSIPDVYQLWKLFRSHWWARIVWASADICQSLLANPTSTHPTDEARRQAVRQRNIDYNVQLQQVCAAHAARCRFDGNAVFNYQFARSDVSGDYFHPSLSGQANLASVSWSAGYSWSGGQPPGNLPPTAGFTSSCSGLTCAFTDASTDDDGAIASWSWAFGDGNSSTAQSPPHTYAAAGTYSVTLTVIDDDGDSDTATGTVTVSAPSSSITLSVTASKIKGTKTADLAWSGATGTQVDIYRDGVLLTSTVNDGAETDSIGKGGGTHLYRVCETGSTTSCSSEVTASY